jgi:hypothetical protein
LWSLSQVYRAKSLDSKRDRRSSFPSILASFISGSETIPSGKDRSTGKSLINGFYLFACKPSYKRSSMDTKRTNYFMQSTIKKLTAIFILALMPLTACMQTNSKKTEMKNTNTQDSVVNTEAEWKTRLSEDQYYVLRERNRSSL